MRATLDLSQKHYQTTMLPLTNPPQPVVGTPHTRFIARSHPLADFVAQTIAAGVFKKTSKHKTRREPPGTAGTQ